MIYCAYSLYHLRKYYDQFFSQIFFAKKLKTKTVSTENLHKHFRTKKAANNILEKLTVGDKPIKNFFIKKDLICPQIVAGALPQITIAV